MRILHINDSLGLGGTETSILELASWLKNRDADVFVAALRGPIEFVQQTQQLHLECIDAHPRDGLVSSRRRLSCLLSQFNPQIVHVHSFFGHLALNLARPGRKTFRIVSSLHNLGYDAWPANTPYKKIRKWLHGRMLNKADWTVSVSSAVAEHYQDQLGVRTDEVIPDPVPKEASLICPNTPADSSDSTHSIVLPGRITREKGHSTAIEALELLRNQGRAFRFEALGGGPMEAEVRSKIGIAALTESTTVSGTLAHVELLQRLANADICIIPSLHEGLGIVALEAMALGVPVIASDAGGLTEVVKNEVTGLTVPAGDAAALARAIAQLLDNPKEAQLLANKARQAVEQIYGIDRIGGRWLETYEKLLSN